MNTVSRGALALAAALYLPVIAFSPNGLVPLMVTAAGIVIAVLLAYRPLPVDLGPVSIALVVGFLYALASASWSVRPFETVRLLPGLGGVLIAGMVLVRVVDRMDDGDRRWLRRALILGGIAGYVLLAFEMSSNGLLHRMLLQARGATVLDGFRIASILNREIIIAVLFSGPFALAIYREFGRTAAGTAIVGVLALALFGRPTAAMTAGLVGLGVFALARWMPRATAIALSAVLAIGVVAGPWLPGVIPNPLRAYEKVEFLPPSSIHRIIIWQTTARHIRERPIFGYGLDTARSLYDPDSQRQYSYYTTTGKYSGGYMAEPIPLHPHNGFLQVWLELGAVGAAIMLVGLMLVVRAIMARRPGSVECAGALGTFAAVIVIYSVSFGAWQSWWLCGLFLLAAWTLASLAPARTMAP